MLDKIFKWTQGRSTGFFIAFFTTGTIFHWLHRLDATFITFMTALLGFVVGHSYKTDLQDRAMANLGGGETPPADPGPPAGLQSPGAPQ